MKFPIFLSLLLAVHSASALTVRVDPAGGAPRIIVDGKAVRARMFWGGPGAAPLPISPEAQVVTFDFTAPITTSKGTIHFRFGNQPGEVFLDDIEVLDLASNEPVMARADFEKGAEAFKRDWHFWPTDAQNTVGAVAVTPGVGHEASQGLKITLTAPPAGPWPDFHIYSEPKLSLVEGHRYRTSFWAKASTKRDLTVALYEPGTPFIFLGGPATPFESQIRLAADAGIDFVSYQIPLPWPEPGKEPQWAAIDALCRSVLRANPKALLLPRIGMDPPPWWCKAHPDEVMTWEDGHQSNHAVPASPLYRKEAAERLTALIEHLEQNFGDQIAGYHPVGQNTGEWFYHDTWKRPLNGYAPADNAAWQRWRAARGLDPEPVPTAEERHASPGGTLRNPIGESVFIEWAEFQQQMMAECVTGLAKTAREATHGKKLVVFFYGYLFEFSGAPTGPAVSGHYALRQVLDSPDIDVLCSPISYFDRGLGGSAPSMSAAESVALAGKLWLNEDDTHTYLAGGDPPGSKDHVDTVEKTIEELTRNVGQEALRNFGTWWMDLGSSGWFNDAKFWQRMAQLKEVDQWFLDHPTPFTPEIAAVVDEQNMLRVTEAGSQVSGQGIYRAREALGRIGAPYGQYLLDDVLAGRVHAKLYVFLNAWRLSVEQRAQLEAATSGASTIWCYAPPGEGEGLTRFRVVAGPAQSAWVTPTDLAQSLGMQAVIGLRQKVKPLYTPEDATEDETLFKYADGKPAVAFRREPGRISLFVGAPGLTSELLRFAAHEAGVQLFVDQDCNVYANGPYLVLHGDDDGPLMLNPGKPGELHDALTGEVVPRELTLRHGETRILRY